MIPGLECSLGPIGFETTRGPSRSGGGTTFRRVPWVPPLVPPPRLQPRDPFDPILPRDPFDPWRPRPRDPFDPILPHEPFDPWRPRPRDPFDPGTGPGYRVDPIGEHLEVF